MIGINGDGVIAEMKFEEDVADQSIAWEYIQIFIIFHVNDAHINNIDFSIAAYG